MPRTTFLVFASLLLATCGRDTSDQLGRDRAPSASRSLPHPRRPRRRLGRHRPRRRRDVGALRPRRGASYENLSGGGGGRALAHFIATAERQRDTLLISSTPIVIASLRGRLRYSWRDLVPVASVIGDYITFAARADSELSSFADVTARYARDPPRYQSPADRCWAAWTTW